MQNMGTSPAITPRELRTSSMSDWLLPWKERGRSGPVHDSFLWASDRLYVMDNHRLALWCWWQHLKSSEWWTFHHVDRHFDALWERHNPWPTHTTAAHRSDLEAFRSATFKSHGEQLELYRWDTITSALWSLHRDQLTEVSFATAGEGDPPAILCAQHVDPWQLPSHFRYLAESDLRQAPPRIVDIDIDYFTHQDLDGAFGPVYSDSYIEELARSLRMGYENDRFGVITIALSPTTTGSWSLAENVLRKLLCQFPEADDFFAGAP